MADRQIYLDHNATTPLHPEVQESIRKSLSLFGNPSSLHAFGRAAREKVEEARSRVARFIGAEPDEIIFVGSGSEANNTVLSMFACDTNTCGYCNQEKTELITTAIEHPCVLATARCLKDRGMKVSFAGVDSTGKVDEQQLVSMITEKTGLISVMMANNEIGTVQDIKKFASITRDRGVMFHTDAVQAVGKIPIDVKKLGVDFLTLSGHKLYGPKGVGALYARKGIPFCPLIRGGHQERGRRAGTENTIGIIALGKAIEMRSKEMAAEEKRLLKLKKKLVDGIRKSIPDIQFNGHPTDCLPGTLNVSFDGAEGEAILLYLDLEGISVSTGSACASGSLDPSHVLLATGLPVERAHGSMRISLGRDNTDEDVDYVLARLPAIMQKIRSMSTAYGGKS